LLTKCSSDVEKTASKAIQMFMFAVSFSRLVVILKNGEGRLLVRLPG
jgi:hypothetical protein